MPYSFGYAVVDGHSYNNYGQQETSDGKAVTGSYRVDLPDGRTQIVTYKADEYGFVADVQYEGEAKYDEYKPAYPAKAAYPPKAAYAEPTYPPKAAYVEPAYPPKAAYPPKPVYTEPVYPKASYPTYPPPAYPKAAYPAYPKAAYPPQYPTKY